MGNAEWWAGLSAAERSARARLAALARADRGARRTEAARAGFRRRLYEETDPALPHEQRAALAEGKLRAHMARMTVRAAAARRAARTVV